MELIAIFNLGARNWKNVPGHQYSATIAAEPGSGIGGKAAETRFEIKAAFHGEITTQDRTIQRDTECLPLKKPDALPCRDRRRVVVPLMTGGILAGFVTSFATASVELSATIMLVNAESDAPLAFGIYEFMQQAAGRGPGAALGIIAVLIVGIATYISHSVIENINKKRTAGGVAVAVGTGAAV
jgi:hypothetical protein